MHIRIGNIADRKETKRETRKRVYQKLMSLSPMCIPGSRSVNKRCTGALRCIRWEGESCSNVHNRGLLPSVSF